MGSAQTFPRYTLESFTWGDSKKSEPQALACGPVGKRLCWPALSPLHYDTLCLT